jgi:ATP-dependent DNA ligase
MRPATARRSAAPPAATASKASSPSESIAAISRRPQRLVKCKCLNRGEFVIVGWSDPEGSRPFLGSLLLAYHDDPGRLLYAGRVGTGMSQKTLTLLHRRLALLAAPAPRETRFDGRLVLSKVHWVRPDLVDEITYLTWAGDGLLRHTVFVACARTSLPAKSDASARLDPRQRLSPRGHRDLHA